VCGCAPILAADPDALAVGRVDGLQLAGVNAAMHGLSADTEPPGGL
jgi:hypothetical protein